MTKERQTAIYRLVDRGWIYEFQKAAKLPVDDLLFISPFIKAAPLKRIVSSKKSTRVLTRFNEQHFLEGVSDLDAVTFLLKNNAQVRGIKNLHAKLYLFGNALAIVTSANLTDAALTRNHELGFVTNAPEAMRCCRDYFEQLWVGGARVTLSDVHNWAKRIRRARRKRAEPSLGLRDHGAEFGFMPDAPAPSVKPTISQQAFLKFFGTASGRAEHTFSILAQIEESGCHWALSYPKNRRPRQVADGNVMFIGRMVHSPSDTLIYGRAVAYRYKPGRDDASRQDIRRIGWKKDWPHYIRVRDPEFISGTLDCGVSLRELMDTFGAEAFRSTAANRRTRRGNTNPRKAIMRKGHIPLTETAANWLNARFEEALTRNGRIPIAQLERLYWPPQPAA